MLVVFLVLDQDLQVELILVLLLGQSHGFLVMVQIFANLDGRFDIEEVTFQGTLRQEMTEVLDLLFLDVAIQQQSCMFFLGQFLLVDLLQVLDEVIDLRHVQELADHVGWLHKSQGEDVLSDGPWVVVL